jgi:hypothetical protein
MRYSQYGTKYMKGISRGKTFLDGCGQLFQKIIMENLVG